MKKSKKVILLSYISVASVSGAIITPALPTIKTIFHLTKGELEWIITIFLLGYMFGQLIYGPLSNRLGRILALRIGFFINLVGICLALISTGVGSYFLLLFARLITALGAAAGLCCTFTLIHELLSEEEAKKALSHTVLSFTLGIGLSIFLGGVITQYLVWFAVFWLLLLHGLFVFFSTWLFSETLTNKQSIHPKDIVLGYVRVFRNKQLIVFSLFFAITSVFSYCYSTMAPMIAHGYLQINAAEYGSWNAMTMIGMFFGSISVAHLIKRLGPLRLIWVSVVMISIGFISFIVEYIWGIQNVPWFFITATYLYFFSSWLFPGASLLALNTTLDKANASSGMNFINMFTAVASVAIMGYLPFSHFTSMLIILCAFVILCALVYCINRKKLYFT